MKSLLRKLIITVLFLIFNCSYTQPLWNLEITDHQIVCVGGDTTLSTLYSILETDSLKYDLMYGCAAELLAIYQSATVKDYVLEKTKFWENREDSNFSWYNYYEYQKIKGFLGEESASIGMDTVINYSNNASLRKSAIWHLTETGNYNYYDSVKSFFLNQASSSDCISLLGEYGKDDRFRSEVIMLLSNVIEDSTDELKIHLAALSLSEFDSLYAVELLDNRFRNSEGTFRRNLFKYLELLDPQNQMQRSMWVIPQEPNENLRFEFIPLIYNGNTYESSKEYLSPIWIKFIKGWLLNETSKIIKVPIYWDLKGFLPSKPNTSIATFDLMNDLINLEDTIYIYTWLGDLTFSNDLKNIVTTAKTNLQNGDSLSCRVQVKAFQDLVDNVYKDSLNTDPRFVTIEGWKFLYWNAQYILDRLPEPPANPNLIVNLKNSNGTLLTTGSLQYYEGGWKDAVNNGDGTFTVITTLPTISLKMTYEYASLTVSNIPAQNNTYTFQTVNAAVQLKNSLGNLIDVGTVQYYAGAWRTFGTTSNGVAYKELLPINYSFRMTYEYGSIDKQQNLSSDPTVVFQTVNAAVQLKNSLGNLIDVGTVQYYAGAWRTFGTTVNGVAYKELLPLNYSFRMTYEYASIDKQQNLSADPTVVFQTVNAAVQLKNSLGNLIDVGTVQYYAGAWRSFGTTANGVAAKELLPLNYSFRMTYEYISKDKQQNLSINTVVDFTTVLCSVKVSNTQNQPLNNADVKYYAGAWRSIGTTGTDGIVTKELLPSNIIFRATYGSISQDKQQDISVNNLVEILLNVP